MEELGLEMNKSYENGAVGFIHLEDRVVWYRIWSINIPLVATPLFQAHSFKSMPRNFPEKPGIPF